MTYHCFSKTERRAAKVHRCIWCGEPIGVGERYIAEESIYDGTFQNHHWHPECLADAEQGWVDGDDTEFMPHSNPRPEHQGALA
jgi:hypothetical protein